MSSLPQSPLAQGGGAGGGGNQRNSGRVFAFNVQPGGKALVLTPRGTGSGSGNGNALSVSVSGAGGSGGVGDGEREEEVVCDEAFVTIGACLEVCTHAAAHTQIDHRHRRRHNTHVPVPPPTTS